MFFHKSSSLLWKPYRRLTRQAAGYNAGTWNDTASPMISSIINRPNLQASPDIDPAS